MVGKENKDGQSRVSGCIPVAARQEGHGPQESQSFNLKEVNVSS